MIGVTRPRGNLQHRNNSRRGRGESGVDGKRAQWGRGGAKGSGFREGTTEERGSAAREGGGGGVFTHEPGKQHRRRWDWLAVLPVDLPPKTIGIKATWDEDR